MSLPRDFLDEIEIELAAARRSVTRDCTHIAALEELHRLARAVTHEFARPITVFDFSVQQPRTTTTSGDSPSFANCGQKRLLPARRT